MIYPQQQTHKNYTMITPQKYQNKKISLKTNRTHCELSRTQRTLSFQSTTPLTHKYNQPDSQEKRNQVSSIEGMFRYSSAQKNCYGLLQCGNRESIQGAKIGSKIQVLQPTAQSLRSSYSSSSKQKNYNHVNLLSSDRVICAKNTSLVNLCKKQDPLFTDNDFNLPTLDFTSLELSHIIQKRTSLNNIYRNTQVQNGIHTKFSLKTTRQNYTVQTFHKGTKDTEEKIGKNVNKISQFAADQVEAGCPCLPQCFWIDKWLKLIKNQDNFDKKRQVMNPKILSQIQKDISRTQPRYSFFKEVKNQNSLKEIHINYSLINPSLGYVQGMNFIASVLVYHSNNIQHASAIFNFIMKQKQFQRIYEGNLNLSLNLAKNIVSQLSKLEPYLFNYIIQSGIDIQLYLRSFYFSMFGNFVPLQSMHFVIDKFIKKGFQGINQLLLALLVFLKTQILELSPQEVALAFTIQWLQKKCKDIDWLQLMGFSQNISINKVNF